MTTQTRPRCPKCGGGILLSYAVGGLFDDARTVERSCLNCDWVRPPRVLLGLEAADHGPRRNPNHRGRAL